MAVAISLGSKGSDYSNLGTLYQEIVQQLSARGSWKIKSTSKISGVVNVIFGEPQGGKISWKILGGYQSLYPGVRPLVNYYRGFQSLCRKSMMVRTLKEYIAGLASEDEGGEEEKGNAIGRIKSFDTICPETYLFYPAKSDESQRAEFLLACQTNQPKIWILKPSDGTKGHSIRIMISSDEILDFIDSQMTGSIAWVVQRYLERPLLIPRGRRKFDIRIWVLLDSSYRIHVYRQGVLRVTAKSYEANNWSDLHSHLSNHCIAETHPDYGKYEPTNEIWFDEFEEILSEMSSGRISFHQQIVPKMHEIIRLTLMAVKENWECNAESPYRSFAVFGYDFMLTEKENTSDGTEGLSDVDVWLIEINSSPAVAEKLLPMFATKVIELAIDPILDEEGCDQEQREYPDQGNSKEGETSLSQLDFEDFVTLDC